MRLFAFLISMVMAVTAQSKTTYIPMYRTYMHIVTGGDTIAVTNNLDTLELADPEGMFTLRIDHEDVTKQKVKAIKRAKRASGWATFAAVMSGISTTFSDNSLQYLVRLRNAEIASAMAVIYNANTKEEQTLEITAWIDNNTNGELMVCDMERGLTWWILPMQSLELKLNNPEASQLRISDPKSDHVRYATIIAGSKVSKRELDIETDDYWYSPVYKEGDVHKSDNLLYYIRISKADYSEVQMTVAEFKEIKKTLKK